MARYEEILQTSFSVLLVDWISTQVPRTLLESGFLVFGSSPGGYSQAELLNEAPDSEYLSVFPPEDQQPGFLVFRRLATAPSAVDIVYAYRPAEELEKIITTVVSAVGAKTLWLQPPVSSDEARQQVEAQGKSFVEGIDIVEAVKRLGIRKH
ncbi:MAG TPA: CoA-binding protein [Pyrinomonadaceae bacterium]|nr:CoA-binding protein [Pyrinomonadaceae bacterium]